MTSSAGGAKGCSDHRFRATPSLHRPIGRELLRVLKKGLNPQEEKSNLHEEKKNPQEEKMNLQEEKMN